VEQGNSQERSFCPGRSGLLEGKSGLCGESVMFSEKEPKHTGTNQRQTVVGGKKGGGGGGGGGGGMVLSPEGKAAYSPRDSTSIIFRKEWGVGFDR